MQIRRTVEHGFTIVEAVVALAIVTTGVLSLASLSSQVTDTVARSRRHTSAAVLADQAVAERLRQPLAATSAACLRRDTPGCVEALDDGGLVTAGPPAFMRRWRAVAVPGVAPPAWGLTVCVVPVRERLGTGVAPGACVSRVVWEAQP